MNIRACSECSDKIPFKGLRPWVHPGLVFSLFYLLFDNIRMANLKYNVSPPFGWLFIECSKAECFFSATQWWTFYQGIESISTQLFEKNFDEHQSLLRMFRYNSFQRAPPMGSSRFLIKFFFFFQSSAWQNNPLNPAFKRKTCFRQP